MNQQQALEAINAALRKTLEKESVSVTMQTDLVGEEIVDSLDGMVFLLELSGMTDKKFPDTDLVEQGFFKVKKLVGFLTESSS
jgi:acyl carrier protein